MDNSRSLIIVYYIYINPLSNWRAIVEGQLSDLKSYGLLDEADLYVHITDTHQTKGVSELVQSVTNNKSIISRSALNRFEYPAIKLLYDLASSHFDKIFMYLHTKGMSYNAKKRSREEQALLSGTFKNWRKSMEILRDHPTVNKVGLFPAKTVEEWKGWIWFNFFIARGSYLKNCEEPVITDDRYYYEAWIRIGNQADPPDDCYSLFSNRSEYFGPEQVTICLNSYSNGSRLNVLTRILRKCFAGGASS